MICFWFEILKQAKNLIRLLIMAIFENFELPTPKELNFIFLDIFHRPIKINFDYGFSHFNLIFFFRWFGLQI